jgi:GNAT superfamily N-acetyltransferase
MDGAYAVADVPVLPSDGVEAAIDAVIAAVGRAFEWKLFGHDRPADLLERLQARGFRIGEREELLAFDLSQEPAWMEDQTVEVRRIDEEAGLADFRTVAEEVFGKSFSATSSELALAIREGFAGHRVFVAYTEGIPAAAGRLVVHPDSDFGYLGTGAVRAAYRGRGLYRAVVAARARLAKASGAKFLLIDAQPTSEPIVRKMGFERLTSTWPCEWRAEPSPPTPSPF